jgi:hypothetical protein
MSLRSRLNHLVQRTVYWLQVFRELGDENHPKIRQLRNALQYVPGPIASTNAIRRAIAELLLALGDLEDETESESDDSEDDNSNPEHFIETEVDDMNLGSGMKGRRGGMINENNGNDRTQINDLIDEINHCDFLVRQAVIDGEERAVRYYKNQVERRVRDLLVLAFNGRNSTYTLPEAIVNLISEYL